MPRTVTLVVLDDSGRTVGALPAFDVDVQWWPQVAEIVAEARDRYGVELQILRLLHGSSTPPGGEVTYLAQLPDASAPTDGRTAGAWAGVSGLGGARTRPGAADDGSGAVSGAQHVVDTEPMPARATPAGNAGGAARLAGRVSPVDVDLTDDPRRAAYARPGGPAETLRWAYETIERLGRGPVTAQAQQRTWNLSALWRLEARTGPLWIKQVPSFFWHESVVLAWLGSTPYAEHFPVMTAGDEGRMLLEHISGEDLFNAETAVRDHIAADLHPAQELSISIVDKLVAAGLPDRRGAALQAKLAGVVDQWGAGNADLHRFVDSLPDRMAAVAACGLPDTLCHGDLHPGNVRGGPGLPNVIIDWGDAFAGNPGFDILRLTEGLADRDAAVVLQSWAQRWRSAVPGCDPIHAVELLRPCAALRNAAVYADFLAKIEPSEYPYHEGDVPLWLARTAELVAPDHA